jgi:acyl-coenzyme A synthetase/AMP-(fatty) acid ligase
MSLSWFFERLKGWGEREAVAGEGWAASYRDLLAGVARWREALGEAGVGPGQVVAFEGDYGERTVTLLLSLIERGCVAVPLASVSSAHQNELLATAHADFLIVCGGGEAPITRVRSRTPHPLLDQVTAAGRPGLILFSSGSTGNSKAILHDFGRLLEKFGPVRAAYRILSFLLLDHIGGINTLFYGLANGGTVVTITKRSPEAVCRSVERHRVEVLPTTPTFLNLLLLSGEHGRHDLSSLRLITYGTEVMPASTLGRLREELPGVRLQQTYGLSELGILRSKSREDGSLWVKVGGEGYETKVVDGVLWVRGQSAMLGYLNVESAFDAEGWFNTEDAVEQDGEWLRFLGRTSEIINVGGQKVYPGQVESTLLQMEGVLDVAVRGEPNPLLGNCVVARVRLHEAEPAPEFKARMRRHCQGRLAPYMVPLKVEVTEGELHNGRCKRVRKG